MRDCPGRCQCEEWIYEKGGGKIGYVLLPQLSVQLALNDNIVCLRFILMVEDCLDIVKPWTLCGRSSWTILSSLLLR